MLMRTWQDVDRTDTTFTMHEKPQHKIPENRYLRRVQSTFIACLHEPTNKNRSGLSTRYTKLKIVRCIQSDFGSEREVVLGNAPFDLSLHSLTSHKDVASAVTGAVKALAAVRHCRLKGFAVFLLLLNMTIRFFYI